MFELSEISKNFGRVQALQDVSLVAAPGSIHGVIGENGAGKSTLMKILTGFLPSTSGSFRVDGKQIALKSPKIASALGVGMLYQEPLDFPQLTVLDNFLAGSNTLSRRNAAQALQLLCEHFGFQLSPGETVERLTVGERQQIELLRLINHGVRLLILDEPTTGISRHQRSQLFGALKNLKSQGCAILLVSHKLDEVDELCDRVTVLRHGRVVFSAAAPFERNELLGAMFGELPAGKAEEQCADLQAIQPESAQQPERIIKAEDLSSSFGRSGLHKANLTVHKGEVVGLAGVDGSGQSIFLKAVAGLVPVDAGQLHRFSQQISTAHKSINSCRISDRRIMFLPADRIGEGLFPGLSLRDHQLLATSRKALLAPNSGFKRTREAISEFKIKGQPETFAEDLSGGNQQRLLLSLLPDELQLLLLENPTRGLDVHSAAWCWDFLTSLSTKGCTLLFASPDLDEIMSKASRVLVFYNGRIVLDKPTASTSHNELSLAITGQTDQ